jgi:hypothetical protein
MSLTGEDKQFLRNVVQEAVSSSEARGNSRF